MNRGWPASRASFCPLIRDRTREGCFLAFRHNNWVGLAVFAGTTLDYALR